MKIVIIGGVASGAKAAAKSKRMLPDSEIDIYTQDTHVSYSACGLPFYIEGNFKDYHNLIIRTPYEFEKSGINIHLKQRVIKINPKEKTLLVLDLKNNNEYTVRYDKLLISTGAKPYIPNIRNCFLKNIYTLRTLEDGIIIKRQMQKANHITIVGGGYIGLELLEAFVKNHKQVTLVEQASYVMSMLDDDISKYITEYINYKSSDFVKVITNDSIVEFTEGANGVNGVKTFNGQFFNTDMVLLASGIRPNVEIAEEAGIELGETGAIKVTNRMETNIKDIYAAGDCVEKINLVSNKPVWIPLGSIASKEGRCAAVNLCGGNDTFNGILGSAVTRYFSMTISKTGLTEKSAIKAGFTPISTIVTKKDKAGYMPQVKNITIKLIADKYTHKLLGGQAIGCGDADKRINTLATGLINGIKVEKLLGADITYAPPFSTTIDPLLTAARKLSDKLNENNL